MARVFDFDLRNSSRWRSISLWVYIALSRAAAVGWKAVAARLRHPIGVLLQRAAWSIMP
jgi:hypothetical protein